MSGQSDFDRRVRAWLEPGPTVLSDSVLDAARAEVHLTRQRRAVRVPRRYPMSQSSRLLVAAFGGLAAIVIVGLGLKFISTSSTTGNPILSPSSQPSHTASPEASSPVPSSGPTRSPATTLPASFPKAPAQASDGPLALVWKAAGPTPSSVATGVPAIAPDGRIWVPSGFESKFWIFSPTGKYLESWGSPGTADGQFDFVYTTGGTREAYGAIAFANDGTFWVADTGNHRVQHFDKDRTFLESLGDPSIFDKPVAIALNDGGEIYVDDAGPREIQQFNSSLAHVLTFASGVAGPYLSQEGHGWIDTDALPDGRPGWTEYKPDGTYQGSIDLSAICHYPTGLGRNPNHDMFIACMTGSGRSAQPEGIFMADESGTGLHFWSTGGAGIAISPTGDAVFVTIPGSPDLAKYALPVSP
jgi:DNA-binding beta-propeller fold protein YncE